MKSDETKKQTIPHRTSAPRRTLRAMGFLALLAFAIEALFFNFHAFRLLTGGFSYHNVPLNQVTAEGFSYDERTGYLTPLPDHNDYYFELTNFNQKAGTIYVDFQVEGDESVCKSAVWYTDQSNDEYVMTELRPVSERVEESKYFTCWFYGSSRDLRVCFNGAPVTVTGFEINKTVPWKLEPLRFFGVFGILLLLYLITRSQWFLCPAEQQQNNHRLATLLSGVLFFFLLFFTVRTSLEHTSIGLDSGDLYSQDLTDAFLAGRAALLTEPDPLLKTLPNPYDIDARNAMGLFADGQYRMDVSYYNDHYYCYFGPVPSLLLFVPYTMVTGQYLQTAWACLFFALIAAVFMAAALEAFVLRYMGRLPYGYLFLGNLILWFSSGLLWNLRRPMFYELAILSSAAFVAFGFYMIITATGSSGTCRTTVPITHNTVPEPSISGQPFSTGRLTLGCLSLALAVGCRPLSILYSVAIIPVLWSLYCQYKENRQIVRNAAVAIALPYLLVGGLLAFYNYIRFGSVAEFGVTYQLSTIDMTGECWKPQILPICTWLTMFAPPTINCNFPFVYGDLKGELYFLGTFARQHREIGLFFLNPVLFLLLSPTAYRQSEKTYGKKPAAVIRFTLLCALAIFVFSSFTGGVAVRYATDYGIAMSAIALLLFFGLYTVAEEKELTGLLSKFLLTATAIAVFLGFFRSLTGEGEWMWRYYPDLYLKLQYIFCFWM